jgi:hypothetical protein
MLIRFCSMELILNLLWLALAIAGFSAVAIWRRQRIAATAVFCLVALGFPIISITDDLSHDMFVAELSVKRRTSQATNHRDGRISEVAVGVLSRQAPQFALQLHAVESAAPSCVRLSRDVVSLSVRAPPFAAV